MVHFKHSTHIFKHLGMILILLGLFSCKSDVEDKTQEANQSVINVDSLKVTSLQNIRADKSETSIIVKKYYAISACLSENNLGQKLDRRPVEVQGTPLQSNVTDPSGCIFWEHTFNMDYSGKDRCQILKQVIKIPGSRMTKTLNYAIDTITDQIIDLERGKGCTVMNENGDIKTLAQSGGELILEKVNLYWAGEEDEKRSDVRTLTYRTNIQSCLKARVSNTALTNTLINIQIRDRSNLHDAINIDNVRTNEAGCFDRLFSSPYEQFSYSHWLEKDIVIEVVEGPLQGARTGTMVYVNPYEITRTFFGIDSRWDHPMENPLPRNKKIHIDGVMYIQIGNDVENFDVNDYLNLTVSKSYQIVLNPRIDRGHRFTKDAARYVKMHDGRFRLKFMILAPDKADIEIDETNFEDFTYITGAERIVEVKDGIINSLISIPVKLQDLPRLATRTVSVFKLEPITDTGIISSTVTGFFKAKIAWIKTNVIQSDTLQTSEEQLSYRMDSREAKNDAQSVSDQISSNIESVLSENMAEPSKGSETLDSIELEGVVTDETKLKYKKCIEYLFTKAKDGVDQTGTDKCDFNKGSVEVKELKSNPFALSEDSKSIFVNKQLAHMYPNLISESTLSKEERDAQSVEVVEATNSEQNVEEESSSSKKFNLPEGVINGIYDKLRNNDLTKEDKPYMAVMALVCRDAFPEPEQGEGILARWLGRSENPDYTRCIRNPEKFFNIDEFMHSKKVTDIQPRYSTGFNLSIGARFSTSYGTNRSTYMSKRVGADLGVKLPLGEYFGAGIKLFDLSYTWSEGESENENWSDDVSTSRSLAIEKFVIDVNGEFEKCILFTGKDYISSDSLRAIGMAAGMGGAPVLLPSQYKQYNTKLDKQYYLCDQPKPTKVSEPWYYIQADVPSAPMLSDNMGPTEKKLIKVLRGEETFNQFKQLFEDETKVYLLESQNNSETPDEKLYENWGHLLEIVPPPSAANKLLINNYQGAFPGTIQ